jgi:O-antigen ligase
VPLVACTVTLFHSYSRAAWLGIIAAVFVTLAVGLPWRWLLGSALAVVLLALTIFGVSRNSLQNSTVLEYFVLHGHIQYGQIKGSDEGRLQSMKDGIAKSLAHPLGTGFGTTGPATLGTENANVTENYYLQIAIETGLVGLLLFMAVQLLLAGQLLAIGVKSDLAAPLLGALAGLAVVNLFLHGWADSSTALVFWTAAGVTVGSHGSGGKKNV